MRTIATLLCLAVAGGCGDSASPDGGTPPDAGMPKSCGDAANVVSCGGSCVDTSTDVNNCGKCGNKCAAAAQCCAGACVETASCGFAVTSLQPTNGYQNGGGWIRLFGSGFAKGMKVMIGEGRAPVLVQDPTLALIQLPPGPLGKQDVSIVNGNQTAVLRQAFNYESGDLLLQWQQKPMKTVRGEDPGVAVMQDGRVIVAGGTTVPDEPEMSLKTAEIYTRTDDTVKPAKNEMSNPRWQNAAVTLLTGKVLVVGGACRDDVCTGDAKSADLFDPKTDTFAPTSHPLHMARYYMRWVLLVDGRVLLSSSNDPSVEIYDPATDDFTLVKHSTLHAVGFMVRLRDGRVLFGGGDNGVSSVELFDSDKNEFTAAGSLNSPRAMCTAHTLPDGRVMVIGGTTMSTGDIHTPLDTVELYDPKTNMFTVAPYKLNQPRAWHASALVRDGSVLVMGGYTVDGHCDSVTKTVDQIYPLKGTSSKFSELLNTNTEWSAVTLLDGSVLGVGGGACGVSFANPDLDFLAGGPG